MTTCPSCAGSVPEGARFCSRCGAPVTSSSEAPTAIVHGSGTGPSSGSLDEGRFTAGTVLAGRYRIIGLLGRGGMGEVYRADDLTLAQPVALKFLPAVVASEPARMTRFLSEVRIARQISHPNVCRVYDIGEVDGQRFLSMEYVDGEDLASLLRRIGRFSTDKAVEIARQICAGLAAAHDRGVVHRDLKPANVMIDGRGKVRITDFGLAGLATEIQQGDARVGTPAYMSPEQLAGKEVTMRSDLYALGLVLYEMFTGRPPFKRGTIEELRRDREEGTAASPSSLVGGLDPAVERAILRCLEKDPKSRPGSALAVAASLPGGDPLAAALAAGETPAPEMVAAAGEEGALRPAVAWACLAVTLLGLAFEVFSAGRFSLPDRVPLEKPPDVLADRAREVLNKLGHSSPAADKGEGFEADNDYLTYVKEHDTSLKRWDRLASGRPAAVYYWYRQSPQRMIPHPGITTVKLDDPALTISGMATVLLDGRGRLIRYEAVPPQVEESEATVNEPDWTAPFEEAELDPNQFTSAKPAWTPPAFADRRMAWEGSLPEDPATRIRIEAAGYRDRIVSFRVVEPWSRPERMEPVRQTSGQRIGQNVVLGISLVALLGALLLAWRSLKLGRGDRAGAFKVAGFFLAGHLIVWILWGHHVPDFNDEWQIFYMDTGFTLFLASLVWLLYMGLEPFVRRRWPGTIISWTRVLAGRFRDPRVGRDILIGGAAAAGISGVGTIGSLTPGWLGWAPPIPSQGSIEALIGFRWSAAAVLDNFVHPVMGAMALLFVLLLLRILLRNSWLAGGALIAILTFIIAPQADYPWLDSIFSAFIFLLLIIVPIRFGLLASTICFTFLSLSTLVLTPHLTAWYAGSSILALLVCSSLAIYGFVISLGGRPMFSGRLLEEG